MARKHGKNAAIYVDQYNVSGLANQWDLNVSVDTAECTAMGDAAKAHLEGDYGVDFSFTSFFDTGTSGWDDTAYTSAITNAGTSKAGGLYPYGTTAGNVAYEVYGIWTGQSRGSEVGSAVTLDGAVVGDGGLSRGQVLYAGSISATGTTASIDLGTKASGLTGVVVFRLSNLSGAGNMVFAIEESSDNAVGDPFAAVAAYASGTLSAVGVTRKTTTGATERYIRLNTTTFAPTSVDLLVTIGELAV